MTLPKILLATAVVWLIVFFLLLYGFGCGVRTENAWNFGKFELGAEASIGGKHKTKESSVTKTMILGPDGLPYTLVPEVPPVEDEERASFFRRIFKNRKDSIE